MREAELAGSAHPDGSALNHGQRPPMRILFVTWDGPQVSYLESLFLPIFVGLKEHGFHFDVLQFRWGDKTSEDRIRTACHSAGAGYRVVPIWRWAGGAGPFLSALWGGRHVRAATRAFGSEIIMPRSLMPAIAVLRAGGNKLRPILFDSDGLAADERVDVAGLAPTSLTYRILRDTEAQIVRLSASVITRTRRASDILYHRAGPPVTMDAFHTVANGRDEAIFHPHDAAARQDVRRSLGVEDSAPLLVYAGSIGPQYRMEAMSSLFNEVRQLRPDAQLLVLTGSPDLAAEALGSEAKQAIIMRVPPEEVARFVAAADVGLAYRSTAFSMQGIAPVKLSEYLLCGLPVIGTAEIGDTKAAVDAGLFLDDPSGSQAAARWFVDEVIPHREIFRHRAREAGKTLFSLSRSVADYLRAFEPFRNKTRRG